MGKNTRKLMKISLISENLGKSISQHGMYYVNFVTQRNGNNNGNLVFKEIWTKIDCISSQIILLSLGWRRTLTGMYHRICLSIRFPYWREHYQMSFPKNHCPAKYHCICKYLWECRCARSSVEIRKRYSRGWTKMKKPYH